ncbi:MAG: Hpt domain-containing protein [Campylobacterota bacterium]|nr:Hpt domain-containing protein [Campylobacterota bacterium]
MDENIFFDEMKNKINIMHNILIDLKEVRDDKDKIDELFRTIHTIKGSADLLYLVDMVEVSHKVEDLLTEIRDGNLEFNESILSLFMEVKDFLALILNNIFEGITDSTIVDNLKVYFKNKIEAFMPKTILVLNNNNTGIDTKLKELSGYKILLVDDIEKAEKICYDNSVSLLFIDIENFYYDGLKMINRIHTTQKYQYLPVVLIVSKSHKVLDTIRKQIGAKAWIEKPIDIEHLHFIIKKIV